MPGRFGLGAAEFEILVTNDQLLRGFAQSQAQAQAGSKKIADAIKTELAKIEGASAKTAQVTATNLGQIGKAGSGVGASLKSAFAIGAGIGGVTVGLATVHQALSGIVDVSQRAAQAQFALRASFGASAGAFTKFAAEQSEALKLTEIGFKNAATTAGTLTRNYGFTNEQIKTLISTSADLAAVHGLTLEDAVQRVVAAMRGEAEAAERLGLTLNSDAVKAMGNMTDAQRKNFETLDRVTKGQILFDELLRQSAFSQGEAKKRSEESAGAFDRFGASVEKLSKAIGESFLPGVQASAAGTSDWVDGLTAMIDRYTKLQKLGESDGLKRLVALTNPTAFFSQIGAGVVRDLEDRAARAGSLPGLRAADADDRAGFGQDVKQRERIALEAKRREGEALLAQAKKDAAARIEIERDILDEATKVKDAGLKAANEAQAAELKLIDDEHRARLKANAADIDGAERAKDAAIKAAQDRHDAAVELIESEATALARARELEDRGRAQTRQQEDRDRAAVRNFVDTTLSDRRDVEDRALDDGRKAEDRALTDRRAAQDQAFDDERDAALKSLKDQEEARSRSVDAEIASIERRKDRALRALDQEADKARASAQKRIRAIEDEADADVRALDQRAEKARDTAETRLRAIEDSSKATLRALDEETEAARDNAAKRLRAIDDNSKATLRALDEETDAARDLAEQRLRALDEEAAAARDSADQRLRAIEDQQRAEDQRHREAMDNLAAEEAIQLGAIDERLQALDTAQRLADEAERDAALGAERARAGRGLDAALRVGNPAAIAAARKALAEADAAIDKEQARRKQDATRRDLQEQAAAIRTEFDAKKDALEADDRARKESADAEQRQIQDTLAEQLGALDKQKQAIKDVLDLTLDALDQRKQAIQDTADQEQQAIQDVLASTLDSFDQRKQALQDATDAQQQQIKDVLASTLDALAQRKQAVQDTADAEQQQIQDSLAKHLAVLDQRKLAIQDSTASEIASIRERDLAASDAYAAEVQRVTAAFDDRQLKRDADRLAEDRALEDSRAAEDLAIVTSRDAQDAALAANRLAEDQALADGRLAEDQALADGRTAQDDDLKLRRKAADDALKAERDAIDVAYNGPAGILTLLRKATDDINEEHRLQAESVRDKYDGPGGIKDIINKAWDAVVAESQAATTSIEKELKKQVTDWETWGKGTLPQINKVIDRVKALIKAIQSIPGRDPSKDVDVDSIDADRPPNGGGMALPPASGGGLAYGPVVRNASDNSYWTSDGTHGGHPAADIFAPAGSPIYAPVDGTLESYSVSLGGNAATMMGADGRAYYFAHAQSPMASGSVRRGEQIGKVGNTGNARNTPPHVHFAISKSGAGTFDRFNGSGDVMGDASYWGKGGVGVGTGDGEWVDVELFGKKYRIFTNGGGGPLGDVGAFGGSGPTGMELINAIEKLGTGIRNQDFGYAGAAIAHSEGAAGNLRTVGTGGAWGPFQFSPGGELPKYAKHLGFPTEQAGPYAGQNPMHASNWALRGYLGSALDAGIDQGIRGAPLADYGARVGQRPAGEFWRRAGDSFRTLYGYAKGGPIPEPSWIVSQRTGLPYAEAGEMGPEDVVPRGGRGASDRDGRPLMVQVNLDGRTIAEVTDPHLRAIESHDRTLRRR